MIRLRLPGASGGDTVLTFKRNVNLHPGKSVAFPATISSIRWPTPGRST